MALNIGTEVIIDLPGNKYHDRCGTIYCRGAFGDMSWANNPAKLASPSVYTVFFNERGMNGEPVFVIFDTENIKAVH